MLFVLASLVSAQGLQLFVPEVVMAGQNLTISGSGASPKESVTLSENFGMQVMADPLFRLGATYCIESTDVNSVIVEPIDYVLVGWTHEAAMEETMATKDYPYLDHGENPRSVLYDSVDGRVQASKPYHGEAHVECWKLVMAGKALNETESDEVNLSFTVKRSVKADESGNFTTIITLPASKILAGSYVLNAQAGEKIGSAQFSIDASGISNDLPAALIYAPDLQKASWKTKAGAVVRLDGTYSADNDGSIVFYEWDFGDGENSTEPSVDHIYKAPGERMIKLTVTDDKGDRDSMTARIAVS